MSNEEMRIAIATVCGWTEIHKRHSSGKWVGKHSSKTERGFPILCELPNYTGSLDAMAEARKALSLKQRDVFVDTLIELIGLKSRTYFDLISAPANLQAECFLRAVGRWQEKGEK